MKHLYALITAIGIEFSSVSFAKDHDMSHQPGYEESIDIDGYQVDFGGKNSDVAENRASYNDPAFASAEWNDGH